MHLMTQSVYMSCSPVSLCINGGINQGFWPIHSWNGENPIDMLIMLMMLNQMCGKVWDQPSWLQFIWKCMH